LNLLDIKAAPAATLTCTSIFELLGNSWQIVQVPGSVADAAKRQYPKGAAAK